MAGTTTAEYCAQHAPDEMVDIKSRKSRTQGCGKRPLFGVAGITTAEYCAQHAPDGTVNVFSKKCRTESCGKIPSFGVAGTKSAEYCAQHAPDGMVNVCSKKCRTEGCDKQPSFGVAGTKMAEYCAQHAPYGMFDVCSIKCRTENCGKGVLCAACTGRDGQRQEQKVQNPRLRKGTVVRSCRYKKKGVLCAARTEPKVAERGRRLEWQAQQRRTTVHSAPDYKSVSKNTGTERLAHTTSGRKPLVTQFRVAPNIRPFILLPPRQANRRVLARTLISEYDTQMLRLRCRSELSHESPLQKR